MEISYIKCLFENEEYDEAIKKGRILVDLLNGNNSNNCCHKMDNELKGKIYGDYGLYLKKRLEIYFIKTINEFSKEITKKKLYYINKSSGNLSPQLVHKKKFIFSNRLIILNEKNIPQSALSKGKRILYSSFKDKANDIPFNDFFQSKLFKKSIKEANIINHYLLLSTNLKSHNYIPV